MKYILSITVTYTVKLKLICIWTQSTLKLVLILSKYTVNSKVLFSIICINKQGGWRDGQVTRSGCSCRRSRLGSQTHTVAHNRL